MAQIERVTKGSRPTLLEAKKANQLIDLVNAIQNQSEGEAPIQIERLPAGGLRIGVDTAQLVALLESSGFDPGGGGGGGGTTIIIDGETEERESLDAEEFTVCVNGTPETRYFLVTTTAT